VKRQYREYRCNECGYHRCGGSGSAILDSRIRYLPGNSGGSYSSAAAADFSRAPSRCLRDAFKTTNSLWLWGWSSPLSRSDIVRQRTVTQTAAPLYLARTHTVHTLVARLSDSSGRSVARSHAQAPPQLTQTLTHRHENTRAHRHTTTTPPTHRHSRPNDFLPFPRYLPPSPRLSAVGGLALSLSSLSLAGALETRGARAPALAHSPSRPPPQTPPRRSVSLVIERTRVVSLGLWPSIFIFSRAGKFLVRTISCWSAASMNRWRACAHRLSRHAIC